MTTDHNETPHIDGSILDPAQLADRAAIHDLAVAYAYAVDTRDWPRYEALFIATAHIDYTAAGGIAGTPAEVTAWMPQALSAFAFTMHTVSTHEIEFTDLDTAKGRAHVFNRNGVMNDGRAEICDVSTIYEDEYVRVGNTWKFSRRAERDACITGGAFAAMVREFAATQTDPPPFG
ncbi:MAG: nuclear transport factor 2 family protein [Acidimicrobiia bacterium]